MDSEHRATAFEGALLLMDRAAAREALKAAANDPDVTAATEQVVVPALERIGDSWEVGTVSLAQLYMAGRIAEQVVAEVLPQSGAGGPRKADVAIVVLEDHHALGKRLVLSALRAAGHDVADYGHGVTVERLVQRCHIEKPKVLLVSTLMLPAALRVREAIKRLSAPGPRPVVIVGGAPFRLDPELWREMGADATGRTSADAIALVDRYQEGAR